MPHHHPTDIIASGLDRRNFMRLGAIAVAGISLQHITGCAKNPVTGQQQLMLMSREEEIDVDKKNAPHQFSNDFGKSQDKALNNYVNDVGMKLASKSHRPDMPYNFQAVNAVYVNAYAFPGGSIACTRGILVELDNEAELAGLLGHELGHVNARHTASRMSKGMLLQAALLAGAGVAAYKGSELGAAAIAAGGGIGASLLLAHYSREDERQADHLGMVYMTESGYSPKGMVGLMDVLRSMHKSEPSTIEQMFASHPMSSERYETALMASKTEFGSSSGQPLNRERYKDETAALRKIAPAIRDMQEGQKAIAQKKYPEAEEHLDKALKTAPNDYVGLMLMSKCMQAQGKTASANTYADKAKHTYPQEAQARHMLAFTSLSMGKYDSALAELNAYQKFLPGNPNTSFMMALAYEGKGNKDLAARNYYSYLQQIQQGEQANHAFGRLQSWGYLK